MLTLNELDKLLSALSSRLEVLGYDRMSEDVLKETGEKGLKRYVDVIVNNAPPERKEFLVGLFREINLL